MNKNTIKQKNQSFKAESKASNNANNGYNFLGNSARMTGVNDTKGKR